MSDLDSNPFADPTPDTAQTGGASSNQGTLDDYNPFAQTSGSSVPAPQPAAAPPAPAADYPVTIAKSTPDPPPYTGSAAQHVDTSELQRRQEELEKKAAELQERENKLREQAASAPKQNNWPPLPSCCKFQPCFYQDFELDIPTESRTITKIAYYTWIVHAVAYLLNTLFAIGYVSTAGGTLAHDAGVAFGLSILFTILFVPTSFICWYRPVYKAFRSDSSVNFFMFFIICFAQIIVDVICVLGINGSGFLGILTAISMLNSGGTATKNMGIVMFVNVILFIGLLVVDIGLLIVVHRLYRGTGASFSKAQSEFTTGVLRNESVRTAGSQLAADAASSAFKNAANNTTNDSGNRY